MPGGSRNFLLGSMIASMVVTPLPAAGLKLEGSGASSQRLQKDWNQPLSEDEKILQLLNRITFGPRPGDVESVRQVGLDAFLDQQLHPERIDDSAVESKLAALPTLSMSTEELLENYPQPKKAFKREERRRREESGQSMSRAMRPDTRDERPSDEMSQQTGATRQDVAEMQGPRRVIMELAQEEVLRAIYSNRQLQEEMVQFWMNHFNIFAPKGADKWLTTSFERDTIRPHALGKFEDLLVATAKSPAMLFYLDNWMSATSDPTYAGNLNGGFEKPAPFGGRREPCGMGRGGRYAIWRSLGWPSSGSAPQNPNIGAGGAKQNKRGLNENYARELMELHTLGVDGGYTQQDVIEVARCLTGWTIDRSKRGGEFIFNPRMHDFGEKVVLDHRIRGGHGMEDGLQVLRILAHHPSTAHFISLKLCRRFVADDLPAALVDRASQAFLKSDGDIRAVLKTILTSPEFYSRAAYEAKVKSPLELVASSLRALGADTDASFPLLQFIARMGQPMFQYQAPTGFPDRASTWINSSALLMRMNYALMLASNHIRGTQVDLRELSPENGGVSSETAITELSRRLLGGPPAPQTRETIIKELAGEGGSGFSGWQISGDVSSITALLIASPEFQRR